MLRRKGEKNQSTNSHHLGSHHVAGNKKYKTVHNAPLYRESERTKCKVFALLSRDHNLMANFWYTLSGKIWPADR